ncbi:hypothetical protein SteCoe_20322 [Stentor coeruleus]|uniref:Phosphatidylinositol-specific phospholipase C X domain-containing protein n=1 Tax=Stentor coeruleus TaxID=5963 RepID=A0A1R2BSA5_9CILI|nr:hypothetical protein SteCoe_20322 [Stentor coeruleus]
MEPKYIQASTWMRDSLHIIGHKTLQELVLPGTHDSGAYSFTKQIMPGSVSGAVHKIIKIGSGLLTKSINKMEKTQMLTVYKQLKAGTRYLDLRAGYINDDWYIYHCHTGPKLQEVLQDVKKFLSKHECEFLIIEISHFRNGSPETYKKLQIIIEEELFEYFVYKETPLDTPLFTLISSSQRALVCVPKIHKISNFLWNNNFIKNTYPNKNNIKMIRKYNEDLVSMFPLEKKLLKVSWIFTPNFSDIKDHLIDTAVDVNEEMHRSFENMHARFRGHTKCANIIIVDNFAKSNIMKIIYKMNKILI